MAIYIVERTDEIDYEEYESVLVRAKSYKDAKDMVVKRSQWCKEYHPAHTEEFYRGSCAEYSGMLPYNTHVFKVEPTGDREVLMTDFHAG